MPVMVDTSVWLNLFRQQATSDVFRLKELLGEKQTLLIGDLILTEILQGARTQAEFVRIEAAFQVYRVIPLVGETIARQSASYYRQLRDQGITVRRTIDCFIATWCIRNQVPLLHADRDFKHFLRFGLIEA